MTARPFVHPATQRVLLWDDVSTWWCFDCLQEADDYHRDERRRPASRRGEFLWFRSPSLCPRSGC